jgi:hypothetical protein
MQQLADRTLTVQGPVCGGAGISCNYHNRLAPVSYAGKRAFDVVAATAGLVLSSPMFLLVSIAIKIDSRDPVFQPQMLHGYIQLLRRASIFHSVRYANAEPMTAQGRERRCRLRLPTVRFYLNCRHPVALPRTTGSGQRTNPLTRERAAREGGASGTDGVSK